MLHAPPSPLHLTPPSRGQSLKEQPSWDCSDPVSSRVSFPQSPLSYFAVLGTAHSAHLSYTPSSELQTIIHFVS